MVRRLYATSHVKNDRMHAAMTKHGGFVSEGPPYPSLENHIPIQLYVRRWVRAGEPSLSDDAKQVLHDEHEVIGVSWARLEIEVLVEPLCAVVFGVNENGPRADRVRRARCA